MSMPSSARIEWMENLMKFQRQTFRVVLLEPEEEKQNVSSVIVPEQKSPTTGNRKQMFMGDEKFESLFSNLLGCRSSSASERGFLIGEQHLSMNRCLLY